MSKTLNWGLLSTARINRALIPPLQVSKRNHLLAVASRSQATANAYAKEKKISRAHGSYEAIIRFRIISMPNGRSKLSKRASMCCVKSHWR